MTLGPISGLRHLRNERSDWLLTVLTGVLILLIFVIAPLQAVGVYAFHLFAIGLLLAIVGSMVIISNSPTALVLMSIALAANIAVFFLRLYYPVGPRSRKPATVSASALAPHLDCSRTYITKLVDQGVIQRQGDGFPLDQNRVAYLRYLRREKR